MPIDRPLLDGSAPVTSSSSLGEEDEIRTYKSRAALYSHAWTKLWFAKWLFPMAFGAFGFYIQSGLLHYATYKYVQNHYKYHSMDHPATTAILQESNSIGESDDDQLICDFVDGPTKRCNGLVISTDATDEEACQSHCCEVPTCTVWQFGGDQNKCYTGNSHDCEDASSTWVGGRREAPTDCWEPTAPIGYTIGSVSGGTMTYGSFVAPTSGIDCDAAAGYTGIASATTCAAAADPYVLTGCKVAGAPTRDNETLGDPLEDWLGPRRNIKLPILDAVAAFFPGAFVFGMFIMQVLGEKHVTQHLMSLSLQVWTKVFLCAGMLFIFKGILGAVSNVPDSSGWETCKNRLTDTTESQSHALQFMRNDTHTLGEMFGLDFWYVAKYHHPLRYCADMMYSGHTFVVTLFALGCYEVVRVVLQFEAADEEQASLESGEEEKRKKKQMKLKSVALSLFAAVAIGEQLIEIYCVMISRFHYSMDIFVALAMTFLLYTNSAVAIFCKQWELRGPYFLVGKYPPANGGFLTPTTAEWNTREMWVSRGDVYLPICCFPFCCLAGRQHVYSDKDMREIGHAVSDPESHAHPNYEDIEEELSLREGSSFNEFQMITHCCLEHHGKEKTPADGTMTLVVKALNPSALPGGRTVVHQFFSEAARRANGLHAAEEGNSGEDPNASVQVTIHGVDGARAWGPYTSIHEASYTLAALFADWEDAWGTLIAYQNGSLIRKDVTLGTVAAHEKPLDLKKVSTKFMRSQATKNDSNENE